MNVLVSYSWIFGLQEDQIPRNYTIALGTPQVLPIQMATGYATFANGGYRVQPHFIQRIEDAYGKVIYEAKPEYACIPCINAPDTTDDEQKAKTTDDEVIEVTNKDVEQNEKAAKQLNLKQTDKNNSQYRQAQRILKIKLCLRYGEHLT